MKQNDKLVVGITGGSGSGKSYLTGLLRERGYDTVDADVVARDVMKKGEPCLLETAKVFGDDILVDGNLDRKKLAEIVFSDSRKLDTLNKISHKYILDRINNMIEVSGGDIFFVDGAVLIESGFSCDKMIGVVADYDERKKRIMHRDGLSEVDAKRRLDAQQKDEFYYENCDFVVCNNDGIFDIDSILKRIME